ncbi:MAG: nucleoside 2-deoxyribosyltransferase [Clostridia bacterium]|nr:nucleoside 2-deoxyribosyltransferase [Clostridia bacterium]
MKIYIAAPLFCIAEKKQNEEIDNIIRSFGHETYLPQRDGGCFADSPDFINGRPKDVVIHELDINAINWCDTLLFVFDGRVPDEGACFELGYAYAKGKRCIGFKTDSRSLIGGVDNLMLTVSLQVILRSINELKIFLQTQNLN